MARSGREAAPRSSASVQPPLHLADPDDVVRPLPQRPRRRTQADDHQPEVCQRPIAWDEWVLESRAAEQLGVSVATLRRVRALGELPFTIRATHVYFHPDDLSAWMARGYGRTG